MTYEEHKARRIQIVPPLTLKQKIEKYAGGNMSEFIMDAVREKIAKIEEHNKKINSVKGCLT